MSNTQENSLPSDLSGAKEVEVKKESKNTENQTLSLVNTTLPNSATASSTATELLFPLLGSKEPKIMIVDPDVENLITLGSTSFTSAFTCGFYDRTVKLAAQLFGLGIQNRSNHCIEANDSKRLDEFPDKLIKIIVDYLELVDRIKFRRVCKKFHVLTPISYGSIRLFCNNGKAFIKLDDLSIFFVQELKTFEMETVENPNQKRAIEALKSMLTPRNLTLSNLSLHLQDKKRSHWAANLLLEFLKSRDTSLSVTTLVIEGFKVEQVHQFLQHFLPGILKNIRLTARLPIMESTEYEETFGKILALEQWKQASDISMSDIDGVEVV